MKKIFATFILTAAVSAAAFAAEPLRTAYFLDGYDFRHKLNPAMPAARSYFALPVLGATKIGVQSNLGISSFLYPTNDGRLTTFMNGSVSSDTFLKKLNKNNIISADFSTSVISIGAWGKKNGFTSVELNLRGGVSANLPRDIFAFMKTVGGKETYDITHLGARGQAYMELSVGHAQRVNKRLSVGGKIKLLLGAANANLDMNKMKIKMAADEWSVNAQGQLKVSGGMLEIPTYAQSGEVPEGKDPNQINLEGLSFDPAETFRTKGIGGFLGGYGAAVDLGFTYEILNGLTIGAAVTDLGVISWKNTLDARTSEAAWSFKGFENVSLDSESENSIQNQFGKLSEGFEDMLALYTETGGKNYLEMLATTVNASLQYKMPFWQGMSLGALVTARLQGPYSWTEGRVSLNFAFGNVLALSGSYAYSTFGSSVGAALNLHSRAFSFYLGTDTLPTRLSRPVPGIGFGVPVDGIKLGVNFGLVFNLSKRKDKTFRE